jgi:hypothetical protein
MVFKFLSRKAKPKRKKYKRRKKSIPKSQYGGGGSQISQKIETKLSQSLETNEANQILARLDVMMGFLREHHGIIKKQIQEAHSDIRDQLLTLATAKKIIKETSLDKIVQEKLSRGETKSQIVRQLIETGACSRATAYRVFERNQPSQISRMSQILSQ